MSETGVTFDAVAIGLAVLGVLVAYAMHVIHMFRKGAKHLVEVADSRAAAQRSALLRGDDRSRFQRIAGVLCITAMIVILAYAFARKIHLI
ncbi:MAG: hypothetical protein ACK4MV_08405 [Beijerinckiaceae bacterium]